MDVSELWKAAGDQRPVAGLTHDFYRYPARFPPGFASAAIRCLSNPGDVVLDPFMGGGTTVVEALAANRRAIGADLNSLSVFVARVKTTPLNGREHNSVQQWCKRLLPEMQYHNSRRPIEKLLDDSRTRNLALPRARPIKKVLAIAMNRLPELRSNRAQEFARCVLLRTAQWALDGRKKSTPLPEFREKLVHNSRMMLNAIAELSGSSGFRYVNRNRTLIQCNAANLERANCFARQRLKADLIVTSPPYPGVHVLYHRWQVDGRRESPAPYWIANCNDGHGAAFYTFGDRKSENLDSYFSATSASMQSLRKVIQDGGHVVQMLAFSNPAQHLPRYLNAMSAAGFEEVLPVHMSGERFWREVPNRKWHATLKGKTHSSREVVLVHRAI